jgi:hypothetical protein
VEGAVAEGVGLLAELADTMNAVVDPVNMSKNTALIPTHTIKPHGCNK